MRRSFIFFLITLVAFPATITKTIQTELQAIAAVTAGSQAISSVLTSTTGLAATIFIDVSPDATNTPGTEFRIEVSQKASGNDTWVPYATFVSTTAAVNSNAVDGTEAAGATVIEEATTTGIALNQIIFFKNTTIANSEWARLVAFTASTSFTIGDGLTNAQTSSTWFNRGERFVATIDMTSITRVRVVCNNNYGASAAAIVWRVAAITADSIG